jgi:ribosomal protein S18 acetylase RimI-like enzyme
MIDFMQGCVFSHNYPLHKMIVRNLKQTHPGDVVNCLAVAFENYYVKVSSDYDYWINRWKAARVDYSMSAGIFDDAKLVGFILHGIDTDEDGILTAFNCGTGILPEYRKRGFVQELYQYLFPALKAGGIQKCGLEVIIQNDIACQSYERVGFKTKKRYKCFFGKLELTGALSGLLSFAKTAKPDWNSYSGMKRCRFSWEHNDKAIIAAGKDAFDFWELYDGTDVAGYAILKPNGHIVQFGVVAEPYLHALYDGIAGVATQVKLVNIEETEAHTCDFLQSRALKNSIDQYYMECNVN